MGATGAGVFENDDAMDFLADLQDTEAQEKRRRVEAGSGESGHGSREGVTCLRTCMLRGRVKQTV